MKNIKAFVRAETAKILINKLEESGVKNLMVEKVEEIADWKDPDAKIYSMEPLEKFNDAVKLEFLCEDNETNRLCDVIKIYSKTGHNDEGIVIVQQAEGFRL